MKFVCLGYLDESRWESLSKSEQETMMQECFAYDDMLRKNGHSAAGEALASARTARTLRWDGRKVLVTDGPFAETREQLGGILVLEARDMAEAVELIRKHPGVRLGGERPRFLLARGARARGQNQGEAADPMTGENHTSNRPFRFRLPPEITDQGLAWISVAATSEDSL